MTNDISARVGAPEINFASSALSNCAPLQKLYQNILDIKGTTPEDLSKLLNEVLNLNQHGETQLSQLVFTLARIAINVSNISKFIFSAMEHYEYPEGKSHFETFLSYLPFTTHEKHLPKCDFNNKNPVNRERFVVCKQAINYFAELMTKDILSVCEEEATDFDKQPYRYKNFGAYLVHSEDTVTKVKGRFFSSWEIRNQWNEQLKENFCILNERKYYCSKEDAKLTHPRTFDHWYKNVLPKSSTSSDVYSSIIYREIKEELKVRTNALSEFQSKANGFRKVYTNFLTVAAGNLAKTRGQNNLVKTAFKMGEKLEQLLADYEKKQEKTLWKELQDFASEVHLFIKEHSFQGKYPDIEQNIVLVHSIAAPEHALGTNVEL
ncbi:MAG: hypothetical protein S4CHLAM6_07560 [Chlamydiae bacterium]|nr:hypothetical protein [Chlamydiota bacterium]